jgi:hypothetical protein
VADRSIGREHDGPIRNDGTDDDVIDEDGIDDDAPEAAAPWEVDQAICDALGDVDPLRLASMVRVAVSVDRDAPDVSPSRTDTGEVASTDGDTRPSGESDPPEDVEATWWSELLTRGTRRPSNQRRRILASRHDGLRRRRH